MVAELSLPSKFFDSYILEGKELEFYMKKLQRKKGKGAAAWMTPLPSMSRVFVSLAFDGSTPVCSGAWGFTSIHMISLIFGQLSIKSHGWLLNSPSTWFSLWALVLARAWFPAKAVVTLHIGPCSPFYLWLGFPVVWSGCPFLLPPGRQPTLFPCRLVTHI